MRYLVIAKDYECKCFKTLMSGTDKEIAEFTKKKENSKEIRIYFQKEVRGFTNEYNDSGDIVIIDEKLNRIKVLYKKDIIVFKKIILNKQFIISTFKSWLYKIYTEADIVNIKQTKGSSYQAYIRKCFKNKETRGDYYDIVRKVLLLYDCYAKEHNISSKYDIYNDYLKNKKQRLKDLKQDIQENISYQENEFYNEVSNDYCNGGIEEIFNNYSLDDLYLRLNKEELESLGLSKKK